VTFTLVQGSAAAKRLKNTALLYHYATTPRSKDSSRPDRDVVVARFIVLQVYLTPVSSSFVRPHAQGSLAVWDSEGLVLSPLSTAMVATVFVIAGPLIVVVLQASIAWSALLSLTALVSLLSRQVVVVVVVHCEA